jgi:hypothetical protein
MALQRRIAPDISCEKLAKCFASGRFAISDAWDAGGVR